MQAGVFVLVLFLATLVEWATERFFGSVKALRGTGMVILSSLIGIGLCFGFNIDALKLVGFEGAYPWWMGVLLSGLIVGSGSNMVHKLIKPSAGK